ncbi:MAG: class I SAM-dependent methyltransferase [Candidatus Saccharibacteria bacterium]|nr:class I SAM-dependent methyltransferase [Candidatus Saccharibacteria bacterium]
MSIDNSLAAEQVVDSWHDYLSASIQGVDIEQEFWDSYSDNMDGIMASTHKLDRGMREIAIELGMRLGDLEDFLKGKSILDIGCGTGRFALDAAKIKKTKVVALDHNPDNLDKVPKRPNIEVIEGSGFILTDALGDREFDVVISSFSSVLWARTEGERNASLNQGFAKTAQKGTFLTLPFISNPKYRRHESDKAFALATSGIKLTPEQVVTTHENLKRLYVAGHMDLVTMGIVEDWQETGQAAIAYRASDENKLGKPTQERYSAAITKLAS